MSASSSIHVLLIEDEAGHVKLFERSLERLGIDFDLEVATTGREGLHAIQSYMQKPFPDRFAVVLDLYLPGMNGIQVLEQLRALPGGASVPVIVLTTSERPSEMLQCQALGVKNYFTKPFDYKLFGSIFENLC